MPEHTKLKAFVVGRITQDALEGSYARALEGLGFQVTRWDMQRTVAVNARMGRIGRAIHSFWPVEVWAMKANRELLLAVVETQPDLVLVFGSAHVLGGTVAQIKASLPECRVILVWPDSLLYCYSWTIAALRAYDFVATYSKSTVEPLRHLGAHNAIWAPLGFDPELHPPETPAVTTSEYRDCDVSFIGNFTPERERIAVRLVNAGIKVKVWGAMEWERSAKDRAALKKYWQGRPLFGKEFSQAVKSTPVSLNPINLTTYPAANMRFFEVPGCGGVSVSARSPELESVFVADQACYYFDSEDDVVATVRRALTDAEGRKRIAKAGQELVLGGHTYMHRARQILASAKLMPADQAE